MSSAKTERLLNLVICLLSTGRPLTKNQIREAVPQYAIHASSEAFERMFERDKDQLRELGIPLITEAADPFFDDEVGYRVNRDAYELPQVTFEPDELAVLGLAARVWQQASLAGPATVALTKLTALGAPADDSSLIGIEPRIRTIEPAFDSLWAAVRDRVPVKFGYRAAGTGVLAQRQVEPWAVTSWRGRWYMTGYDRDRAASRIFRLSRVEGSIQAIGRPGEYQVPADAVTSADFKEMLSRQHGQTRSYAEIKVQAGSGHALRRRAKSTTPVLADPHQPAGTLAADIVTVEYSDDEALAQELVCLGPTVIVLSPPSLREAVIRRLRAVVASTGDAG